MKKKIKKMIDDTRIRYTFKGILVGGFAGFVVSLFRLAIEYLLQYIISLYELFREKPHLIPFWILISLFVALFIGYLIKKEPNIKGSGIPQVEGQLQGEIYVRWWPVLWKKFIGGVLSIGSGLFLGREGPSIQLGALVGQGVSRTFKGSRMDEKILLSSGASAGLAAAFNAPMAGLLFVLEEVHHNFSPLVSLTSFIAAVTANFISLNFFGLTPALNIGKLNFFPIEFYGYLILLGIILGFFGVLYQKVLLALPRIYSVISFLPSHYYGIVPFLLIIPIGFLFPEILGGGSEIVLSLDETSPELKLLIGLFIIRFIFSMISYGGNLPGGIFLPILSLGAILGTIYGNIVVGMESLNPIYIKSFLVFAMAGYFTAIGKAPLTAIVLVTEMVGSLNQLMPLALVSLSAYLTADLLGAPPIYEALLERMVGNHTHDLKGKNEIIEIPIHTESTFDGGMIRDFTWPKNALITSIRRGEKELITRGDTVIRGGDCLIVLTDEGITSQVRRSIRKMSENV